MCWMRSDILSIWWALVFCPFLILFASIFPHNILHPFLFLSQVTFWVHRINLQLAHHLNLPACKLSVLWQTCLNSNISSVNVWPNPQENGLLALLIWTRSPCENLNKLDLLHSDWLFWKNIVLPRLVPHFPCWQLMVLSLFLNGNPYCNLPSVLVRHQCISLFCDGIDICKKNFFNVWITYSA